MSGGAWNYENDRLCGTLFGYDVYPVKTITGEEHDNPAQRARMTGPFEDMLLNELVFDVFCLLRSRDWYISGDTSKEFFEETRKAFREKWLKKPDSNRVKAMIDDSLAKERKELFRAFGVSDD